MELGVGWEGGTMVKSSEHLGKETFRCDGYIGCEVEGRKIYNHFLADVAYIRFWKVFRDPQEMFDQFSPPETIHPVLFAGSSLDLYVTIVACIFEEKAYYMELSPKESTGLTRVIGPNLWIYPVVRSRIEMPVDWPGAMTCSWDRAPLFVQPRP